MVEDYSNYFCKGQSPKNAFKQIYGRLLNTQMKIREEEKRKSLYYNLCGAITVGVNGFKSQLLSIIQGNGENQQTNSSRREEHNQDGK